MKKKTMLGMLMLFWFSSACFEWAVDTSSLYIYYDLYDFTNSLGLVSKGFGLRAGVRRLCDLPPRPWW